MTASGEKELRGSVSTKLTVAVELVDAYTDTVPTAPAQVTLVDDDDPFRRGISGYYLLQDRDSLPDPVEIAVVAPGYLPATVSEHQVDIDESHPVVSVELVPGPSYQFGAGATLVRGMVEDADEDPIPGVTVRLADRGIETHCDERGEFVLWIADLDPGEVKTGDEGRQYVDFSGSKPAVEAERSDGATATEEIELEVGSTTSVTLSF